MAEPKDASSRAAKNRERVKAWRRANPEKARALTKKWAMAHVDKIRELGRERMRRWRLANREKILEQRQDPEYREKVRLRSAAWRKANLEKARAAERRVASRRTSEQYRKYEATYKARHPGRREASHRERQRIRAAKIRAERVNYELVLKEFGALCHICGMEIVGPLHFDHVIPLSRGGTHTKDNIRPAHPICNLRKSNKTNG